MGTLTLTRKNGKGLTINIPGREKPIIVIYNRANGSSQAKLAVRAELDIQIERLDNDEIIQGIFNHGTKAP